ncbi:hypothetical protein BOSP111201_24510 [Bordetella sputigena]
MDTDAGATQCSYPNRAPQRCVPFSLFRVRDMAALYKSVYRK